MKLKHLLLTALAVMGMGSANAQEVPTDGTSYYLYNTETGKFLTRGNDWGTRAIVNNYGQPWKVTVQDGKYKLQMLDMVNAGETAKNLNGDYSDNGTVVAYAPTGDANGYVLGNGTGWLGVSSGYYANTAGSDAAKTWQFLTKDQYDAKQVEIQNAQYQALIDASLIDATPATLASVLEGATATDVTTAAGLNGVPTKSTWAETQHDRRGGNYNAGTYGLECYQTGNAHITKTVNGLDEGIYKVKVKAMYRSTTNAACLATGNAGYTNSSAYFAANGYTVQIKDWYSGHTADAVPNNTGEVVTIINNGGYTSEFYTYVGPSGTLNLEAVSEAYWGTCWFIFNGVELTKYSDYPTQSMADDTDLTSWLTNPSFESGNMNGWTNNSADGMWTMMTRANDTDPKVGVYWVEKYAKSGKIDVSQTLTKMPAGHYQVSVNALDQASKTKLIAQCGSVTVETPIVGGTKAVYTADIMLEDNSDLKIGIYCENHNASSWVGFDDFHLTYVSAEMPELPASVTGLMNATVAAAQTSAVAAFNADKTATNYNAAVAAIVAAQASKDAYTTGQYFVAQANSALNTTFTTSAPTEVAAVETKYNAGEYADNVISNRVSLIGERTTGLIPTYMLGGWSDGLYINTWSTEGDNDGSNFKTPFYEYWVADGNNLADKTITGTLTGLEEGLYSVSAKVRVRSNVSATEATGVNLVAGDGTYAGTEGNGTADATNGDQIGSSQLSVSTVTAYALVKDGNLTANFVVAGANISWLAFQDVTYTKVRELTDAEKAVIPTAIALDKTEATLTAAENTVTLTPSFTPNDATETVTWETSDANVATVANGVVTGVAPGTATITVKSTLDENVKATCEVTVEYAETAYETTIEAVDAENQAAINVSTLSSTNIIKNGSFEYANGYYGWTCMTGSTTPISATGFTLVTENGNTYIKSKANAGGSNAASFNTSWDLEDGKTYVFSYKIRTDKDVVKESDRAYIGTSLSNNKGQENSNKKFTTPKYDTGEWYTVEYQFTNSDNYKYLVFNARWLGDAKHFDDFYLAEVTETNQIGNVQYAIDQIPTTNVGTGAFQYSQDAVDATNALVKGTATVKNVEDAIEAMTTINAPTDGDKFHVAIKYDGYRYSGHALESNGTSGVNVPLADNTANNNYPNDWTFTPVEGTKNGFTMSITTADNTYYVCTGAQDNGSNDSQIRMTTDPAKALTIVISPTKSQEGVYYLNNSRASNASIGCQDDNATKNGGWYTTGSHNTHTITLATKATAKLSVTDAKYGTFIAPFNAAKPAGVTLYTCETVNGNELVMEEADAIEANTAYIAYSESVVNETLEDWGLATAGTYTSGLLTGVYTDTPATDGVYVLQMIDGKVGFYQVDETVATPTVGANRCYLEVPAVGANVRAFFFDAETAISAIEALTSGKAEIYNVNGVKLNKLQKGINIVNGKKIYVK